MKIVESKLGRFLKKGLLPVIFGAAVAGCAGPRVNTTEYVPAVSKAQVGIDRCADEGILVVPANSYNVNLFSPRTTLQRGWGGLWYPSNSPYYSNSGNAWTGQGASLNHMLVQTANGSFIIQFPKVMGVNSHDFSRIAAVVAGYFAGGGTPLGKAVGVAFGEAVIAPLLAQLGDAFSSGPRRDAVIALAACVSDLKASPYRSGAAFPLQPVGGHYLGELEEEAVGMLLTPLVEQNEELKLALK